MGKTSKYANDVIKELKRCENIHNRREAVTKNMKEYIISKGKSIRDNPDNVYSTGENWVVLGGRA